MFTVSCVKSGNGKKEDRMIQFVNYVDAVFQSMINGFTESFFCHNVTIMKNAQGDRVIIQEVK